MASAKAILTLILVVSVLFNLFLIFQNNTLNSEKGNCNMLGTQVKNLLSSSKITCPASNSEPLKLSICLEQLNAKYGRMPVEETGFKLYDTRRNESGYLIITIKDMREYESSEFRLLLNHRELDNGCVIPGNISKDETCKMFFDEPCEKGDALEMQYKENKIHLRTC
ncbi:MAG: hypothetical protein KKG59_04130 [Nanoarchaeota archaeon]|nr:hypothetical protein [Nanoarchaeota archaeon]